MRKINHVRDFSSQVRKKEPDIRPNSYMYVCLEPPNTTKIWQDMVEVDKSTLNLWVKNTIFMATRRL